MILIQKLWFIFFIASYPNKELLIQRKYSRPKFTSTQTHTHTSIKYNNYVLYTFIFCYGEHESVEHPPDTKVSSFPYENIRFISI